MRWGVVAFLAATTALAARNAGAAEGDGSPPGPLGAIHPEIAGRVMYGTALTATIPGPMAGGGFGVRGGVSYLGVYGGLSYMDFLSEGGCLDSYPGSCGSVHAATYGAELGYGRTFFGFLTLRGEVGIGDYVLVTDGTSSMCTNGPPCTMWTTTQSHATGHNFYVAPAALVEAALGPVLVGLDATYFYFPSDGAPYPERSAFAAFMGGVQLGVRL
jgi:hypothetical protein